MTIISIDFSILFPGVCICRDFKTFKWIAGVNTRTTKKNAKLYEDINEGYNDLKIFTTQTRRTKDEQYHITERIKMTNYFELVGTLIREIKAEVGDDDLVICLEGVSFGSSGNSLVDLSQSTGILKNELFKLLKGNLDKFFVFSPGTLKNAIGAKENASKVEVIEAFLQDPIIPNAKKSDLYKLLKQEDWVTNDKGIVLSPIIDMIDSYLGVAQLYKLLK